MKREMARFLQKRKFRLVTRWKEALKANLRTPPPLDVAYPFVLLFRAFDEVIDFLRAEAAESRFDLQRTLLVHLGPVAVPPADHYIEMFLTGREVFVEFCTTDAGFLRAFNAAECRDAAAQCELAFRHLIDREMTAHARRTQALRPFVPARA